MAGLIGSYKNNNILPDVELLPCPFCGTVDNVYFYTHSSHNWYSCGGHSVRINCECGVEGKFYQKVWEIGEDTSTFDKYRDLLIPVYQQAVDFWNSRK